MIHKYGISILHRGYGNSASHPNNYCEVWARHGPDQTQFGKLLEPPCTRHRTYYHALEHGTYTVVAISLSFLGLS
jgi:hypothetical protein